MGIEHAVSGAGDRDDFHARHESGKCIRDDGCHWRAGSAIGDQNRPIECVELLSPDLLRKSRAHILGVLWSSSYEKTLHRRWQPVESPWAKPELDHCAHRLRLAAYDPGDIGAEEGARLFERLLFVCQFERTHEHRLEQYDAIDALATLKCGVQHDIAAI